jgi:4-methyl-5(b-hydroxyethyl)-thiazole monophosphate biosynthesis
MIILPGGMPGTRHLDESRTVDAALRSASNTGAYIAAICAAPMVLGKRGYLEGKKAVCFPGFEEYLSGAILQHKGVKVVTDGKIITAVGMGAAVEFGLALVRVLKGDDAATALQSAILAD